MGLLGCFTCDGFFRINLKPGAVPRPVSHVVVNNKDCSVLGVIRRVASHRSPKSRVGLSRTEHRVGARHVRAYLESHPSRVCLSGTTFANALYLGNVNREKVFGRDLRWRHVGHHQNDSDCSASFHRRPLAVEAAAKSAAQSLSPVQSDSGHWSGTLVVYFNQRRMIRFETLCDGRPGIPVGAVAIHHSDTA